MIKFSLVIFVIFIAQSFSYIVDPGPVVKASVGEVWPKPRHQIYSDHYLLIDPKNFQFSIIGHSCDILEEAIKRYKTVLELSLDSVIQNVTVENDMKLRQLDRVVVNLTSPCERKPHIKMDEWYYVAGSGRIISHSIWGILRGLETFSQLLIPAGNGKLKIQNTRIRDLPRFSHRGLLLDTSRHFMSMDTIKKVLDGMAYNKLNVFHWHIIDDHSFPYESIKFPELSKRGAFRPEWTYSQQDVAEVIEYARLRGIRVVVEVDVPGHTRSWGESHPEILTKCEGIYEGKYGPIDPINNKSYSFLSELFTEITEVFPDQYVHVGGDEVGFECWSSNARLADFVKTHNISYEYLQRIFMERICNKIVELKNVPIVWQEAMVKDINMPNGTVVQVWTGNWRKLLRDYTDAGHRVLLSACWYLDHLLTGGDWLKYYQCDPHDFVGTDDQKKLILGGEACMWSEVVSDRNVLQRIFPRVSAAAERLWALREVTNTDSAKSRLEEHTCRMIARGIPAQPPNGPGLC